MWSLTSELVDYNNKYITLLTGGIKSLQADWTERAPQRVLFWNFRYMIRMLGRIQGYRKREQNVIYQHAMNFKTLPSPLIDLACSYCKLRWRCGQTVRGAYKHVEYSHESTPLYIILINFLSIIIAVELHSDWRARRVKKWIYYKCLA